MEYEKLIAKIGGFGFYQKKLLVFLIPIALAFVFGVSSIPYVTPAIVCEFQVTKYKQGLLYSAIYIGMVPFSLIWGLLSDRIGRKKILIICCSLATVFEFLTIFAFNYWYLFVCKVASGCVTSGLHLTFYVYVSEFSGAIYKDTIMVVSGSVVALGYFLQPLIAAFIVPLHIKIIVIDRVLEFTSWKMFMIICTTPALLGSLIALFILPETPKFLLINKRTDEALKILKKMYVANTGKLEDTFPTTSVVLEEDKSHQDFVGEKRNSNVILRAFRQIAPLFRYPYLIPALIAFLSQMITMGTYNSIRPYTPTLLSLALGIGQVENSTIEDPQNTQFCVLFEHQHLFARDIRCNQDEIDLNPKIYYLAAAVGFAIFMGFFVGKWLVQKIGIIVSFASAHFLAALFLVFFPFATSTVAVVILAFYAMLMQLSLTLAVSLMIGRIPTSMRAAFVGLIMVCGRIGVIIGNQMLPIITPFSCKMGFWMIVSFNLLVVPLMIIFSKQPNPLEEEVFKTID